VNHRAHFVGRQVNISLSIVPHHISVTIAVALHHPLNLFEQIAGVF
jgi:hypothetical protein